MNPLAKLTAATTALAEAKTLDDIKQIVDVAEMARNYAKAAKMGLEAQNYGAEIKLRAERKGGEMLQELERSSGGRPEKTQTKPVRVSEYRQVLTQSDVAPTTAKRWQTVAAIPEEAFEQHIATVKATEKDELTTSSILRVAQVLKRDVQRTAAQSLSSLPDRTYNVVYADPPWQYNNTGVHGAAEHHYHTMTIEELEAFPAKIKLRLAKNAVLFMWITNPLMAEAFHLIEQWGFEYKTNMVWVKTDLKKPGSGFYVRGRHELLFIATRGSFTPLVDVSPPIGSVVEAPVQEHSRKPPVFIDIIEKLYPECSYVELFARSRRPCWDAYGDELAL